MTDEKPITKKRVLVNNLNDLTAREWIPETISVYVQKGLGAKHKDAQIEKQHPAPYSFQDVARLIRFFTKSEQRVLDPFVGIGSTLKACAVHNRKGTGIELVPKYVELSKKRRGWNRSNTYYVVKLLDTKRIPTSDTDKKSISIPIQTSSTPHLGSTVPIHNETPVPSINTYLKGKDKNNLKGLERMREALIAKGIVKPTTTVIKPSDDYQKLSNK